MQSVKLLRNQMFIGVGALVMVGALALITAILYIRPPGYQTITFYTDDAASIRPNDTVRIAGITVGKVKDLSMEPQKVKVRATVEGDAFVGDQSQVQVRMLTVVGGYYVNLVSLGGKPLGDRAIPLDRVTMPYSLVRTLTDATEFTQQVSTKPIQQSLDELQQGLNGTNVDSLSAVIDAGNSLTATIDKQRGQISEILSLSDEYIHSLSNYREQIKQLVLKVSVIEQTLVLYAKGFGTSMRLIGDVLQALDPIGQFYLNHREEFIEKARNWELRVQTWADRNGKIVRALRRIRNKLERVLDAQNARPELLATDLCIPLPGSPC